MNKCNRRELLKSSAGLAVGTAFLGGLTVALTGCEPIKNQPGSATNLGVSIPNQPSGVYAFDFADFPELQSVGGSLIATVNATSGAKTVSLARTGFNSVTAVSVMCTHQTCQLNGFDSNAETYTCPCCGSIFSASGTVIQGPATESLPDFACSLAGTSVQVTVL